MHASIVTRSSAVGIAVAALTASTNAAAHYYAVVDSGVITTHAADSGMFTFIQTDILHNTCNILQHDFVNHEMWYNTDTSSQDWVELGFKDGATNGIDCVSDIIFWADSRPGHGYSEHHYYGSWSMGSWYQMEISGSGLDGCTWNVLIGQPFINIGTSTSNCAGSGRHLFAGLESTSQSSGSAKGFLFNWEEQDNLGTWALDWGPGRTGWFNPPQPHNQWVAGSLEEEGVLNESF
jgi:hypothetical protein